jgi:hypothetical protein
MALALDLVQASAPDPVTGYRSFTLGEFVLSRDAYFATIDWPAKGQRHIHKMPVATSRGAFFMAG